MTTAIIFGSPPEVGLSHRIYAIPKTETSKTTGADLFLLVTYANYKLQNHRHSRATLLEEK